MQPYDLFLSKLSKHVCMCSLVVFSSDGSVDNSREISEAPLVEYTEITENKSPETTILHQIELQKQLESLFFIISELYAHF